MKLLVINPIVNKDFDLRIAKALKEVINSKIEVVVKSIEKGPKAIENFVDEAEAVLEILKMVRDNEQSYDGILINCFADLGVDAAREITNKPVIGAGESSFFTAAMLGVPFMIVTIGHNAQNKMGKRFESIGLRNFCIAVGITQGVGELDIDKEATAELIATVARGEMEKNGAEAVLLGCTGMVDVAELMRVKLTCPVIEPSTTAILALQNLVKLKLSHPLGGKYTRCK